jgi:hypothetical protein
VVVHFEGHGASARRLNAARYTWTSAPAGLQQGSFPNRRIPHQKKEEPLQAPLLLSDASMGRMHRKANWIFASMQMEGHVDHNLHRHWMSLEHGRLEFVLPDCLNSLLFQAHAEMTDQGYILRVPL